jgi:hypothetical protein
MTILLDDIDIKGLKLIGLRVGDTYYRESAKAMTAVAYEHEPYQVTKAGPRKIFLEGVLICADYAEMQQAVNDLTELLASEGTRSVEANNVYYEVFAADGFQVSDLIVNGTATAKVTIPLTQVGKEMIDPEWLLDAEGEYVLDADGKKILDLA